MYVEHDKIDSIEAKNTKGVTKGWGVGAKEGCGKDDCAGS